MILVQGFRPLEKLKLLNFLVDSVLNSSLITSRNNLNNCTAKNGLPHSLNEPDVIITPNFWGEARLVS